jgi:hypothetical protein
MTISNFFRKFGEVFWNECLSAVSTTPTIKEKNFEVQINHWCPPWHRWTAYRWCCWHRWHSFPNMSANFQQKSKLPQWIRSPVDTDSWKNLKSKISCHNPFYNLLRLPWTGTLAWWCQGAWTRTAPTSPQWSSTMLRLVPGTPFLI